MRHLQSFASSHDPIYNHHYHTRQDSATPAIIICANTPPMFDVISHGKVRIKINVTVPNGHGLMALMRANGENGTNRVRCLGGANGYRCISTHC